MRTKQESTLSEEEEALVMEGLLSRKIWRFYELLSKWAPHTIDARPLVRRMGLWALSLDQQL